MHLFRTLTEYYPLLYHIRNRSTCCYPSSKPRHLICFKQWTAEMVMGIINSAINLKCCFRDTHCKRMNVLENAKIMILQEINEPMLNLAVSKAATFLGAYDVNITDHVIWDQAYAGRMFSYMSDAIFVTTSTHMCVQRFAEQATVPVLCMRSRTHASVQALATVMAIISDAIFVTTSTHMCVQRFADQATVPVLCMRSRTHASVQALATVMAIISDAIFVTTSTHMCVQRFADQATVPVLCMRSRTHASVQALATVMAIIEEFGSMKCVNVGWLGPPHPVLNSYLLLCPMLGANIKFKCCCDKCPVNPLLLKASEDMCALSHTTTTRCSKKGEVFDQTFVVIAGPTTKKKEKVDVFKFGLEEIQQGTQSHWIFFHTCPRGEEVPDEVFYHCNARTFKVFENMQFIAAALMANAIKGFTF